MTLVEHRHDCRERGCDQDRPLPVEPSGGQGLAAGNDKPGEDQRRQPDRDIDPESPMPAQRVQDQSAQRRSGAEPDRLGSRLQPERPPAFLRAGGHDDDGGAVRRYQCGTDTLQDAEGDQQRQVRREAAQGRAGDEEEEAAPVQKLVPEHVGEPSEDRGEGGHGQEI
jgi:hypothetical protein